nr:MAG TPA: hypothetical protein [Caudoviricetes sp.]
MFIAINQLLTNKNRKGNKKTLLLICQVKKKYYLCTVKMKQEY